MSKTHGSLPPATHPLYDHQANPIGALSALYPTTFDLKELQEIIQYWKDYLPFLISPAQSYKQYLLKRTIFYLNLLANEK